MGNDFLMAQLPSPSSFGDYADWPGRDVLDSGGERLGGVREIYLDRETGRPEWVLVDVDHADARFVPLADAAVESSTIRVAHAATTVRTAPGIGTEPRIDQSEERRLYAHYGLGYADGDTGSEHAYGTPETPEAAATETRPESPSSWGTPDTTMRDTAATPSEPPPTGDIVPPWRDAETTPAADADTPTWGAAETPARDETPSWALPSSPASEAVPAADAGETMSPSEFEAAYEEASNDAPPAAEPPSPEEIAAADIPEPPAASDRAYNDGSPRGPRAGRARRVRAARAERARGARAGRARRVRASAGRAGGVAGRAGDRGSAPERAVVRAFGRDAARRRRRGRTIRRRAGRRGRARRPNRSRVAVRWRSSGRGAAGSPRRPGWAWCC